MMLLFTVFV